MARSLRLFGFLPLSACLSSPAASAVNSVVDVNRTLAMPASGVLCDAPRSAAVVAKLDSVVKAAFPLAAALDVFIGVRPRGG